MGFVRFMKMLFVKQPKYEGQVTLPYDIETVHETITKVYGGLTGFSGAQIENTSNAFGSRLKYKDNKNGSSELYCLTRSDNNSTQIRIAIEFPTGNATILFEDIVNRLKKELEK